jgi:uncharacterized nucleotidyltransferase DUF6036
LVGLGSVPYKKYRVYVQYVGIATPPCDYAHRLRKMYPDSPWNSLRLSSLDPVDVALAKLERNSDRDREDLLGLVGAGYIDASVLKTRDFEECGLISRVRSNGTIELSIYGLSASQV